MSQPNMYLAMQNQLMSQMQSMNLNNHNMCWDGVTYQHTNNTAPQMPINNNYNMGPDMMGQNMQNYSINQFVQPQMPQMNGYMPMNQETNYYSNQIQPLEQMNSAMENEENKEMPAKMQLPSHVKQKHFRSNSFNSNDMQANKYISNNFLFDKTSHAGNPGVNKLSKNISEGYAPSYGKNLLNNGSSTSLPAIRNMSDFHNSYASESSIFDGNDSAFASSVDIELDANGQPIFDNTSNAGDSASGRMDGNDNSDDAPQSRARLAVKKKSGFAAKERKLSLSDES